MKVFVFSFVVCGPGQRIADHPNGIVISKINNRGSPRHAKSVDLIDCFFIIELGKISCRRFQDFVLRGSETSRYHPGNGLLSILSASPHIFVIISFTLLLLLPSFVYFWTRQCRDERNFSSFIFLMCHFYSLLHVALTYTSSNNLSGGENVAQYVRFWKNNLFQLFFRGQCD